MALPGIWNKQTRDEREREREREGKSATNAGVVAAHSERGHVVLGQRRCPSVRISMDANRVPPRRPRRISHPRAFQGSLLGKNSAVSAAFCLFPSLPLRLAGMQGDVRGGEGDPASRFRDPRRARGITRRVEATSSLKDQWRSLLIGVASRKRLAESETSARENLFPWWKNMAQQRREEYAASCTPRRRPPGETL